MVKSQNIQKNLAKRQEEKEEELRREEEILIKLKKEFKEKKEAVLSNPWILKESKKYKGGMRSEKENREY